ncbi:MAG: cytochrome c biogenesis protein DipZ [Acidimicrobiales bacterium]
MIILVLIGFLGGLVTGISPCILPVLPVIFAAGAASGLDEEADGAGGPDRTSEPVPVPTGVETRSAALVGSGGPSGDDASGKVPVPPAVGPSTDGGGQGTVDVAAADGSAPVGSAPIPDRRADIRRRRQPIAVVGGLVLSFAVFTLLGSWLLTALDLPQDLLRWIGLVVLGLVGLGLIVPVVGEWLERPFARLARGRQHSEAGGFVLGLSLGLVFVPCAGPVLTAIAVVSANHRYGFSSILLTAAFALGVAVPLLIFAVLGQRLAERMRLVRARAALARRVIGAVLVVTALVIGLNLTDGLQRALPGYTNALQSHIESNASAAQALARVSGNVVTGNLANCTPESPVLQQCGKAPAIVGISHWLNTPGDRPLTLAGLRGHVVLIDFWTYSCINCQRTLPHVEAWNRAYAGDGLTVIGIHTPEFAFEHVTSNVAQAASQLGVSYPIAQDNDYATWNAYKNNYWPAEYLVDATGTIRHVDFGEGQYDQTESFIRQLLVAADPEVHLPAPTDVPDLTPNEATTPESYLGYQHGAPNLAGQTVQEDQMASYAAPSSVPPDEYAYGGNWSIGPEASTAGTGATLDLAYQAKDVYLVLGGSGTVRVSVNGKPTETVTVSGEPKLYQLVGSANSEQALLSLAVSPGVQAYDFTFG